jgi:hypothetical protein
VAGVVTVIDVNKRLCNAYAVESDFQKRAQYVTTVAAVYAMYVGSATHGVGAVRLSAYFFIPFFTSVPRIYTEGDPGKVSCAVKHLQKIFVHHVFTAANCVGAVELMVVEISQNRIIASAAMAMMRSAMSARPYSRALYTMFANTVAKIR